MFTHNKTNKQETKKEKTKYAMRERESKIKRENKRKK